ncbi:MAG: N-acetylneuraminate synthase [Roseburia sp.]|nr:N-acetylneuraminate synthase [Roseburia sp.]
MSAEFKIGNKIIGKHSEPFIIAEAGINHNGDIKLAKKMILAAREAGVDAVKFQTFKTEEFIQDKSETYTYQSQGKTVTESQYEMFKRTEFSEDEWREIKDFCDEHGVTFLSTPASEEGLKFLISLGIDAIKISSDDFVNIPLIKRYETYEIPIIASCGMANEEEIKVTLNTLRVNEGHPVCLMLCTSEYPTPLSDVNAKKLTTMSEKFPKAVLGLSDHSQGNVSAIVATALGARVFEKHFTLDHELPGPDHWFSSEPNELKNWAKEIRDAYTVLGKPELEPTEIEKAQRKLARRSITTACDIKKGDKFSDSNLLLLRPGTGIGADQWEKIIGKSAKHDIKQNSQLKWEDVG